MEPAEGSFSAQLRRGVLEHCVLALVGGRPMYGLDLARTLSDHGVLDSEGTLYPLLSRLRRRGLVDTTWEESPTGPPRRYYRLTVEGRRALDGFRGEWGRFRSAVDTLLEVQP
jgi:PadR family transcriptional regulator PadR